MKITTTTYGVIIGTRGFFNSALAREARTQLLRRLDSLGYDRVILPEDATPTGAVETLADARRCADLFQKERPRMDGIVVCLPNFGDELGIVNTLKLARLDLPVLVQACDDDNDRVDLDHRRDAFCGKLSVCNNLYQYGIPFTDTTYHTCDIGSDDFARDLDRFARVCRVVKGLRNARIGAIGARPTAFQTMRASEKLLQASGITVVTVDQSDIFAAAHRIADDRPELKQRLLEIREHGHIPENISAEVVKRQAKYGLAAEDWMRVNEVDCAAIQCWTSIQQNYGCAACLTMSMLGDRLIPCACEVDIAGVLSMYALVLASGNPAAILDWNNNYGQDRGKCVCTHCSNYPRGFMGNPVEISNLDVLGKTLGAENCFGAIKGKVKAGDMTYFRISTDDRKGRIKCYVGEGRFTDDPYGMDGGIAVAEVAQLPSLLKYLCREGFEHHVAMVRGHWEPVVGEAVTSYLGWDIYQHPSNISSAAASK
jgi:L-fucose isomerase-like protein